MWNQAEEWVKGKVDDIKEWEDHHNITETMIGFCLSPDAPLALTAGLLEAAERGDWSYADPTMEGTRFHNSAKITNGLFQGDAQQIASRFLWEQDQTGLGLTVSYLHNYLYPVSVDYYDGATIVNHNNNDGYKGGMTLGSYINSHDMQASTDDQMFMHEYGHYIESRIMGQLYFSKVAVPSLMGSIKEAVFGEELHNHSYEWYEIGANHLAYQYFDEPENWNSKKYPRFFGLYESQLWWMLPMWNPFAY